MKLINQVAQYRRCACCSWIYNSCTTVANRSADVRGRRTALHVVAGETRSANRTSWSQDSGQQVPELVSQASSTPDSPDSKVSSAYKPAPMWLNFVCDQCTPDTWLGVFLASQQVWAAGSELAVEFADIDRLVGANLRRVQAAFAAARVAPHHFAGSSGYGHGDLGRTALDQVFINYLVSDRN